MPDAQDNLAAFLKEASDSDAEIDSGIKKVLESAPLYKTYTYSRKLHPTGPLKVTMPLELDLLCKQCGRTQRWRCLGNLEIQTHSTVYHQRSYRCKNCDSVAITYFFCWSEDQNGNGTVVKVGQYPPLEMEPPSELKLDAEDRSLYKRALTSQNFAFGIGALAYLRRVVENRMNALLDLVAAAAAADAEEESRWTEEFGPELDEARSSRSTFDRKVEFARKILPAHLKPGGHNPFDVLHGFASAGLHGESDEECIQIFAEVREVFEFLFKQLKTTADARTDYIKTLNELASKKKAKNKGNTAPQ